MISLEHYLVVSAILFTVGVMIIIMKKNAIVVLMGIELILNATNINLVAFSQYDRIHLQGQVFALFVMIIAAAEAAVALAIILRIYRYYRTSELDQVDQLKG